MSDFREQVVARLRQLNSSQQSIEGTASWCLFYSRDAKTIVSLWQDEFTRLGPDKKVAQLYLANHLLQEGRKKGKEFGEEFSKAMPHAIKDAAGAGDDKVRKCVERLLDIWETRRVLAAGVVKQLKDVWAKGKPHAQAHVQHARESSSRHQNGDASSKTQVLGVLADLVIEVNATADKSKQQAGRAMQLKPRLHLEGAAEEVAAAREVLSGCVAALQEEVKARYMLLSELRTLATKQEEGVQHAQKQLQLLQEQHAAMDNRMIVLDSLAAATAKQPYRPPQQQPHHQPHPPHHHGLQPQGSAGAPPRPPMPLLPSGPGALPVMPPPPGMLVPGALQGMPPPHFPMHQALGLGQLPMPPPTDAMLATLGMQNEALAAMMAAQQAGAAASTPPPPAVLSPQAPAPGPGGHTGAVQLPSPASTGPPPPAAAAASASGSGSGSAPPAGPAPQVPQSQPGAADAADPLLADHHTAAMLAQALAALPQEERQRLSQGLAAAATGLSGAAATALATVKADPDSKAGAGLAGAPAGVKAEAQDDLMQDADFSRYILGEQVNNAQPPAAAVATAAGDDDAMGAVNGSPGAPPHDDDDYDPDNPF